MANHYSRRISLLKGISWRIIGTLDTILLSFIFTGKLNLAVKIGGIELFTKIFLYYVHERVWGKLKVGRQSIASGGVISYEDKHWRSVAKGISWRVIGTLDTIVIAYLVTGQITQAFEIGFTEVFTKMFLFYLHERLWNKITRYKKDLSENTITEPA
ncbi:MAG: DUF2061 domain-containing protein [Ignavibacteria bacterium]|nr:DUF2061 domain-containing protein [Ignavibacteria bacterium]